MRLTTRTPSIPREYKSPCEVTRCPDAVHAEAIRSGSPLDKSATMRACSRIADMMLAEQGAQVLDSPATCPLVVYDRRSK